MKQSEKLFKKFTQTCQKAVPVFEQQLSQAEINIDVLKNWMRTIVNDCRNFEKERRKERTKDFPGLDVISYAERLGATPIKFNTDEKDS